MNHKKILMISPEPFFEPRGTPFSVYHRCVALSKSGYRIDLLTYPFGEDVEIPDMVIHRIPRVPFIKRVKVGPSLVKIPLDIILFIKAVLMLAKGDYEVIHTHEEASFFGALIKKIFRIKHVYDMHSSLPEQLVNYNFMKNRNFLKLAYLIERFILRESDAVIAICESLHIHASKYCLTDKVKLIENPPVSDNLPANHQERISRLREELSIRNKKVIVYTGTFENNQGLDLLLKSISYVIKKEEQVKYILVGGEPRQIEALKEMASKLGVIDFVKFTGQKPPEEMSIYMAVADILVSPRIIGVNTPLKIYSYLSSGKPILATNLPTHTQVLDDKVAMLVEPTPEGFAKGIIELFESPELCERLGTNAKRLADEKYSYDKYVSKVASVYDMLFEVC